jgi:hypothetical protein
VIEIWKTGCSGIPRHLMIHLKRMFVRLSELEECLASSLLVIHPSTFDVSAAIFI